MAGGRTVLNNRFFDQTDLPPPVYSLNQTEPPRYGRVRRAVWEAG